MWWVLDRGISQHGGVVSRKCFIGFHNHDH